MRTRGLGRVYKRGNVWWVQYSHRGRKYRESSRSPVRGEAVRLLRRRQQEMGAGRLVGPDAEKVTFEELAAMLEADYIANGRRSLARAKLSLSHLREAFGSSRALDITPDRVTAYIARRLAEKAAPATVRAELAALRRMLRLAFRAGKLPGVPYIPSLDVQNTRTGFFEEGQFRAVLAELPEHLRGPIEFAYLTGWRLRSEVLPLTWAQVDFAAGVVRLEPGTTKNGEGRVFPFSVLPELAELLLAQRERTTVLERATRCIVPRVFHRNGAPIRHYGKVWRAACKRAAALKGPDGKPVEREGKVVIAQPELVERIPHDFRRTAVRNLERAGVSRSVAMKLTGHKTESVFRRYAIVAESDLREGVAKLAALARRKDTERTQLSAFSRLSGAAPLVQA